MDAPLSLRTCTKILAAGSLSFLAVTSALVLRAPPSSEAALLHSQLTDKYTLRSAATSHTTVMVGAFIRLALDGSSRFGANLVSLYIYFCAAMTYYVMLHFGMAPFVTFDVFGNTFVFYRFVSWAHTSTGMILHLNVLANETLGEFLKAGAANVMMILFGIAAYVAPVPLPVFGALFATSGAIFCWEQHHFNCTCNKALAMSKPGSTGWRSVQGARFILIAWFIFPIVALLHIFKVTSAMQNDKYFCLCDWLIKTSFTVTLLMANTLSIEESERQAATQIAQARSRQLAQLCHEIRNPLNGIMGNLSLLQTLVPGPGDHSEVMVTASMCCLQLRRILDDILDFDKIVGGKLALDKRPFLVRDVINTAVSQVVVAAHEKQLETLVDIDPDALNLSFVSDSSRITQILSNFGWNSCKFTTEGSVTFRMRLLSVRKNERTLEPESAVVRFEVEDTGPGVDPAMQKVLFQPYEMGVFSRVGKYGGSGLGLNICKALAGLLGATIGCDVKQGKQTGSIFWIEMETAVHALGPSLSAAVSQKAVNTVSGRLSTAQSGGGSDSLRQGGSAQASRVSSRNNSLVAVRSRRNSTGKGQHLSEKALQAASAERLIETVMQNRSGGGSEHGKSVGTSGDELDGNDFDRRPTAARRRSSRGPDPAAAAAASAAAAAPPAPAAQAARAAPAAPPHAASAPVRSGTEATPSLEQMYHEIGETLFGEPFSASLARTVETSEDVSIQVSLQSAAIGVRQAWGSCRIQPGVSLAVAHNAAQAEALLLLLRSMRAQRGAIAAAVLAQRAQTAQTLQAALAAQTISQVEAPKQVVQSQAPQPGASPLPLPVSPIVIAGPSPRRDSVDAAASKLQEWATASSISSQAPFVMNDGPPSQTPPKSSSPSPPRLPPSAASAQAAPHASQQPPPKQPAQSPPPPAAPAAAPEPARSPAPKPEAKPATTSQPVEPAASPRAAVSPAAATTPTASPRAAASPAVAASPAAAVSPRAAASPRAASAAPASEAAPPAPSAAPARPKLRVMVVDDERVNTKLLSRVLTLTGDFDVETGFDGSDLVAAICENGKQFDCIIMDQNMTKMNGDVACRTIRERERALGLPPTPVLVTSGNDFFDDHVKFACAGADGLIPKPIDMGALPGDIHRLFEVRASRISAELLPPTVLNVDIPLPQESAEARAKQLLKLSNSLSLYPWEW